MRTSLANEEISTYLFHINISLTANTDLHQITCLHFKLEEVATPRCHRLVSHHCLEACAIAHCYSDWPQKVAVIFLV